MSPPWKVRCIDTGDGSGDAILILPTQLLAQTGLQIGDELSIKVDNEVMVLQPALHISSPHLMAGPLRADLQRIYRQHLEDYFQVPAGDSERDIHERIQAGFPAGLLQTLWERGILPLAERNRIISVRTLKIRLANNQL